MKANEIKRGTCLNIDGQLFIVVKSEHTKPGKGPAYIATKIKNIKTGANVEKRFNSSETVTQVTLDRRDCEYLYQEGEDFVFMDSETFDQFNLTNDFAGEAMKFMAPNSVCTVLFDGESPVDIDLPAAVDLEVAECEPGVKGATVTNVQKEAIMETGLKTRVPDFINAGEKVRISTDDGSYLSRVKD